MASGEVVHMWQFQAISLLAQAEDSLETFGKQGYEGQTLLHPVGLAAVLILGTAMLLVPRRFAIIPMAIMTCVVAPGQRVALLTLNFDLLRIMVLFGTARLIFRGETRGFRLQTIDLVMIVLAVARVAVYTLQWASLDALKFRLGETYTMLGMYFLFRVLIRDWRDVQTTIMGFVAISVPVLFTFFVEQKTGRNLYAFLGGVPELSDVREGKVRCQGAFAHPILAGCFWVSLMPLIVANWWRGGNYRWLAVLGMTTSMGIILFCASSTPVAALPVGLAAAGLFFLRRHMRPIRWGLLGLVVALHMSMKAPVWHLLSRFDLVGGSTGWQRTMLIDATVEHFNDWWLLGTHDTTKWDQLLVDITNGFILEGIRGGIWSLVLLLVVLSLAFRHVGQAWRAAGRDKAAVATAWALGVSLVIHCANFMAISYFGQITMVFYFHIAACASVATAETPALQPRLAQGRAAAPKARRVVPLGAAARRLPALRVPRR